jgi:hypothetical protein
MHTVRATPNRRAEPANRFMIRNLDAPRRSGGRVPDIFLICEHALHHCRRDRRHHSEINKCQQRGGPRLHAGRPPIAIKTLKLVWKSGT